MSQASLLLVDDEPLNIRILAEILRPENYRILVTTRGQEAIKIATEKLPDLILLDLMLPDISGVQVCQQLQKQRVTRDMGIILVTACAKLPAELALLDTGNLDVVSKPVNPQLLRLRVDKALRLRRYLQYFGPLPDAFSGGRE